MQKCLGINDIDPEAGLSPRNIHALIGFIHWSHRNMRCRIKLWMEMSSQHSVMVEPMRYQLLSGFRWQHVIPPDKTERRHQVQKKPRR
jgi:hypothetical protein